MFTLWLIYIYIYILSELEVYGDASTERKNGEDSLFELCSFNIYPRRTLGVSLPFHTNNGRPISPAEIGRPTDTWSSDPKCFLSITSQTTIRCTSQYRRLTCNDYNVNITGTMYFDPFHKKISTSQKIITRIKISNCFHRHYDPMFKTLKYPSGWSYFWGHFDSFTSKTIFWKPFSKLHIKYCNGMCVEIEYFILFLLNKIYHQTI